MSKVYGEPVNVQARDDGRPVRFVWRGRLYTVRAILEHWVINREWWQDSGVPESEPGQPELEFWRVEASPGQGMTAEICELRREAATDTWTLRLGPLLGQCQLSPCMRCVPLVPKPHDWNIPGTHHDHGQFWTVCGRFWP